MQNEVIFSLYHLKSNIVNDKAIILTDKKPDSTSHRVFILNAIKITAWPALPQPFVPSVME